MLISWKKKPGFNGDVLKFGWNIYLWKDNFSGQSYQVILMFDSLVFKEFDSLSL